MLPHVSPPALRTSLRVALLLPAAAAARAQTPPAAADPAPQIDRLMTTLHDRGQFDGAVLVARGGRVVYRRGFGTASAGSRAPFTPATPSCLASVSKPFTALAIMMLRERGRLRYDDPVARHLPEFARYAPAVTIRHLLTHTSGVPDYSSDLAIERPGLRNADVLRAVVRSGQLRFRPGQRYEYSNTGYVLLALVVERVTGRPFADFLRAEILAPLGRARTFVHTDPRRKPAGVAVGYSAFGYEDDYRAVVTGDGGMYASVDDLYAFDRALYTDRLVRQSTLAEAFVPAAVREGTTTYGLGWNVAYEAGVTRLWHTGNTAGFRAFIERRLGDRSVVIMLTNRGNSRRAEINAAIRRILAGEPYVLPKRSIAVRLYPIARDSGAAAALRTLSAIRAAGDSTYDLAEGELNTLGYQLLGERRVRDAIAIFAQNVRQYPTSSNAFDSLAEAYQRAGDRAAAVANYRTALQLDPSNLHATTMLRQLQ
jgi:CubicO group peptidase (beta-lactamase class C family)